MFKPQKENNTASGTEENTPSNYITMEMIYSENTMYELHKFLKTAVLRFFST